VNYCIKLTNELKTLRGKILLTMQAVQIASESLRSTSPATEMGRIAEGAYRFLCLYLAALGGCAVGLLGEYEASGASARDLALVLKCSAAR